MPADYALLRKIKTRLDQLLDNFDSAKEIHSHELYHLIWNDKELRERFPSRLAFNDFLRNQHKRGYLYRVIENYRMDFTPPNHYKWYFFKENEGAKSVEENSNPYLFGKFTFFEGDNFFIASNGEQLRSPIELSIYEKLLASKDLHVLYDYPLSKDGKKDVANFYVKNMENGDIFLWEHFDGDREAVLAKSKREWYKRQGFNRIEDKGELIFTYADNENEIDMFLALILDFHS